MATKTKTPEEKQAETEAAAAPRGEELEAEGTYVSPTRPGSVEPPLMEDDPSQAEVLEDAAEDPDADTWAQIREALMAPKAKGLHAKLAEVILEIEYIQKTGTAPKAMGGYTFVEAGQIAAKMRRALAIRGVTMLPERIVQNEPVIQQPTRNGGVLNIITITTTWRLTDSETGESCIIESMGTGGDSGDKFSPKAQTNAMKYALQVGFLLDTGDDPERSDLSEPPTGAPVTITGSDIAGVRQGGRQTGATQVQLDTIRTKARELNLDPMSMAVLIASALGGKAPDIDNLETADAQRVILEFLGALDFAECGLVVTAISATPNP